jgi:hypothetical protein
MLAIIVSAISVLSMSALMQSMVYDIYGSVDMPDMKLGYSYDDILQAFSSLGSAGIQAWLQAHLLDLIFPLGYAFGMTFGILMELRISFPERKNIRVLALLPILAAFADYVENTLIAAQAAAYPNLSAEVIAIASGFTTIKWLLLYTGFAIIFILLPIVIYRKVKE